MLGHISIRLKVILAFALVLCCTVALGGFSLQRLVAVNTAAAVVRESALPTTRVLGEMAFHAMRFRMLGGTHALVAGAAAKAAEAASSEKVAAQVAADFKSLTDLLREPDERRIADEMARRWRSYEALHQTYLKVDDPAAATALFLGDMRTASLEFQELLRQEIALNLRHAQEAGVASSAIGASATTWILTALVMTALLCACVGWAMIHGISRPIGLITRAMHRLAANDVDVAIFGVGRGDEIGAMASAVAVFKENAIARAGLEAAQQAQEERATRDKLAAMREMANQVELATGDALATVGRRTETIAGIATAMTESAGRSGASVAAAAAAATEALGNAQTVAGAAEQLSAAIREINQQIGHSTAVVVRAVDGGRQTRASIEALNARVGRIGVVAKMIGDIAARTNLLALNATIEAARAGEAGRGFAVVASEVKALAAQTARSTEDIARQISEVLGATSASVDAVDSIERTINELSAIAASIAAAVEQQGAATAEIARGVAETAAAVTSIAGRIDEVTVEVGQSVERGAEVRDHTGALNVLVGELRRSVVAVVRTSNAEVDRRIGGTRHEVDKASHPLVA